MPSQKPATCPESPRNEPLEALAECLAALIACQVELGLRAAGCRHKELADLMACQLFDAIDWVRLNVAPQELATLDLCALTRLGDHPARFRTLEQLEDFIERHFVEHA